LKVCNNIFDGNNFSKPYVFSWK